MNLLKKLFYLFTPLVGGIIVALLINGSIDYNILNKPPLSPSSIIFPMIWSIIYILLGISYYIFKKLDMKDRRLDIIYYSSLIINFLWSIIFFILKLRFFSILWIIILDISIILLMNNYNKYNSASARLNILYLLWCLFATYLTIGIYLLN